VTPILIIPGWGSSGPGHWQTLWADTVPGASRVGQLLPAPALAQRAPARAAG
jgi:predicted alpha/beta hydrolase family esterase